VSKSTAEILARIPENFGKMRSWENLSPVMSEEWLVLWKSKKDVIGRNVSFHRIHPVCMLHYKVD